MMKIKRLEISGFKSIDEITIEDVPSFMVLAGANGSGKSNFVDALNFLGEVIRTNLNHAVEKFNGEDYILNKNLSNEDNGFIDFYISGQLNQQELNYSASFHIKKEKSIIVAEGFKLGDKIFKKSALEEIDIDLIGKINNEKASFYLIEENITELFNQLNSIDENDLEQKVSIQAELLNLQAKSIDLSKNIEKQQEQIKQQLSTIDDISLLKTIEEATPLVEFLTNIQVFRIDPIQAKRPSLIGSSSKLASDGSNIADVLEKYEQDENFREELMEWMEMIVPNLTHVKSEKRNIDNSAFLHFQEGEHAFPAGLISDGTIYTLCILTAVLSRSSQYGITIIEEPERGIHPQAIGELIALMREKTQGKHNIILTTHSESVVRNLELKELYLVRKENGQTLIKDVKDSGVDKNQLPLDEAWLTNSFDGGLPW